MQYSTAYKAIAYGVNAGGFGLAIGSLPNNLWRRFHLYSFPFLILSGLVAWARLP